MANRSKKTVLSVRISPFAKASLDVTAAINQQSQPDAIEHLLERALDLQFVSPPAFIRPDRLNLDGKVSVGMMMRFVWIDDPELFKLRLHLIEPSALSERDQVITGTVFKNLEIFGGDEPIFDKKASEFIQDSPAIPRLNIPLVRSHWPLLTEYARFLANNGLKLSFPDFVEMLRRGGQNVPSPIRPDSWQKMVPGEEHVIPEDQLQNLADLPSKKKKSKK